MVLVLALFPACATFQPHGEADVEAAQATSDEAREKAAIEKERADELARKERVEAQDRALRAQLFSEATLRRVEEEDARQRESARRAEEDRKEKILADARAAADRRLVEVRKLATTREYAVPAISALVCDLRDRIREAEGGLRRQEQIEHLSGVAMLLERRSIGEDEYTTRRLIDQWTAALRANFSAAPLGCSAVQQIVVCNYDTSKCTPETSTLVEVWQNAQDALADPRAYAGPETSAGSLP